MTGDPGSKTETGEGPGRVPTTLRGKVSQKQLRAPPAQSGVRVLTQTLAAGLSPLTCHRERNALMGVGPSYKAWVA